jgi:O-antigen/teichoic acid export membrane protein
MSLKVQAAKNIGSNWFAMGVNLAVGFFLSPFILHRLGDDAFGLWILIFSLTGYYGLFDFGIRSSIVKYVSEFVAKHDDEELARIVNTALFGYGCLALVLLLLTGLGSWYVGSIFHIPPQQVHTARLLFLIVGTAVALGFPLSVFAGILEGLQKFYRLYLTQAVCTAVRAALIVLALTHGRGLLTIAFITVIIPLSSNVVYAEMVRRALPLQWGAKFIERRTFRRIVSYGSVSFTILIAGKLRFGTDAAIIGAFLSASAITFFSIGSKLVDYATELVDGMANIFLPMSSHFDAVGQMDRLRQVFVLGNRVCGLVMFPICAGLIVLGRSLIEVWVGPKYLSSYWILLLLLVPKSLFRAQAASIRVLFGMARHRTLAFVFVIEGVANIVLSILLIRPWGIVGDAVGTAIPLLCTSLFFLPVHLCRTLTISLRSFLRQAYLLPLALCAPMVAVLVLLQHSFRPHNYMQLLAQVLAGGLVYGLGVLWVFVTREPAGIKLMDRFVAFLQQAR